MVDRVLDPRYLEGLSSASRTDIEERLAAAELVERETSAVRRTLHRIIDDLRTELASRD